MPSNKSKQSKKVNAAASKNNDAMGKQTPANMPVDPADQKENIFIEMEESSKTNLVVDDTKILMPAHQQVVTGDDPSSQSNHIKPEQAVHIPMESTSKTNTNVDIEDDDSLSATVTKLTTANGNQVYLVGTAHFSTQSVEDVQKVIRYTKPSAVILELCRERAFMLALDEQSLLEQNRSLSFEKIRSAIREKGLAQGLIYVLFIKMSANLTEKLGLAPGSEFRAGAKEARQISNCSIVLADRSLKVTVARAVASVSIWQKLKLIYHVLLSDNAITKEDVEKCKDKDILEQLLQELGCEFPGFKEVILDERNVYLAHNIYQTTQNSDDSYGPSKAVAIVGIGHVDGIREHWGKTTDEQIIELNHIPETSRTRRIVTKTVKYCTLALFVYVGYRVVTPTHIQNAIHQKIFG